jgi:alkylation response protein AidB-like acyl-CoA dehydrogenase
VDFELSAEQIALQQTVRQFAITVIKPVARDWEQSGRYPNEIVDGLKRLGMFGMLIPETYGGADLDLISYAIVFEELSRQWMAIAGILGSHSLSTWMLARYGTDDQRDRWLPEFSTGLRRSAFALTEPGAGSDLRAIETVARREGDVYVINGMKTWITNARHADPFAVLVKTAAGTSTSSATMSVLYVEQNTPGLTIGRDLGKLGYRGTESCEVAFNDASVPVKNLLGGVEGNGLKHVLSALQIGRINIAARAVGVAQAAFDAAKQYAMERHAFGQAIAEYQAVQIKLANMATEIQAARLLTWWAADRVDRVERADVEAGMAKYFASEAAMRATLASMRIHGAYGYSTEFEVERLYRDAPLMAIGEGTNDVLLLLIARGLLKGVNSQ